MQPAPASADAELSSALFAAEQAVEAATRLMVGGRSHVRALIDKGDYGFATAVDVEIERLIRERLAAAAPAIPFLGEEGGGAGLDAERVWVLDPIDGTANYADGSPLCAVSLALLHGGLPVLGIVAAPLLGERYVALEGGGCWRNGTRVSAPQAAVGDPLVALSDFAFGHKHRASNALRIAVIQELVERRMRLRIHGSVALDLAWLAAGRIAATVALSNYAWDVSAGVLLAREAGAAVFDHRDEPHGIHSESTIAAIPSVRSEVLDALAAAHAKVAS